MRQNVLNSHYLHYNNHMHAVAAYLHACLRLTDRTLLPALAMNKYDIFFDEAWVRMNEFKLFNLHSKDRMTRAKWSTNWWVSHLILLLNGFSLSSPVFSIGFSFVCRWCCRRRHHRWDRTRCEINRVNSLFWFYIRFFFSFLLL